MALADHQYQIAEKLKTKQPAIVRLENNPGSGSFLRLLEYADAVELDFTTKARQGWKAKSGNVFEVGVAEGSRKEKATR